jgi:hypothetical protein
MARRRVDWGELGEREGGAMADSISLEGFYAWLEKPYIAKGIVGLTEMLSGRANEIIGRKEADTLHRQVARYILARSTSAFSALRLLAEKGYHAESLILLRLLLQNLISLAYINKEPETRAKLYDRQLGLIGQRLADEIAEALADVPGGISVSFEDDFDDQDSATDEKSLQWGKLKVAQMAKECGMTWAYTYYRFFSHVVHGNAVSGYKSGGDPLHRAGECSDCISIGSALFCATLREVVRAYGFTVGEVLGAPYSLLHLFGADMSPIDNFVKQILGLN